LAKLAGATGAVVLGPPEIPVDAIGAIGAIGAVVVVGPGVPQKF